MPAGAGPADELVVTGTRLAAEESKLPSAATVIDRPEIEARNDTGFADLLRDVPGIQVVQPGAGGVTQLFMRGGEPNFTVVLLDGIRVNDPNNTRGGSFDLASLNLADIERVEIVRGPQSSIYGSDGLAGVINVISPGGTPELRASVEAEAGGDDFGRASLRVSGPVGAGGFSLQATTRDDGEAVPGSTYDADTVSAGLRLAPAGAISGNLYLRYADTAGTSFPDQSGGPEYAVWRELDQRSAEDFSAGGDFRWTVSDVLAVEGLVSRYDRSDEYDSPGIAPGDQVPPNGADNDLTRDNAALRVTAAQGAWTATAGVDWQREDGRSEGYVAFAPDFILPNSFQLDRDILGVFAEARLQATGALLLQGSVRHDEPDEESGETTGRLGAVVSLNDGRTRVRANVGTGFKLPSFFALGSPLVGEPNLKPEKSESLELGLIQSVAATGEVSVTLFDNEYEDLIDFDPDTFRNVNRDEVDTQGIEVAAAWAPAAALALRAHATYTDIDVKGSDRVLLQRPDWRGGAALRWLPADDWSVDLDWLYVGDTVDNSIPTGQLTLDDYHRVDLAVAWQLLPALRLSLAVDNLLDASYEESVGFPAAGIRPRLAVRYDFGG